MKHVFALSALLTVTLLCGCASVTVPANPATETKTESLAAMLTTYQFIKDAGFYFIATADGDQPRVRPFGTIHIFENRLYIQTGRKKNVARQLIANGKTELCARKGDEWIRLSGTLVDDNRVEAKASMLDEYSSLKSMYSAEDENTMVLYFQPGTATATIYSFSKDPVVLTF